MFKLLSENTAKAWFDQKNRPVTTKTIYSITGRAETLQTVTRKLNKAIDEFTREEGRYTMEWIVYGRNEGHVINVERKHDGKLLYTDGQKGELYETIPIRLENVDWKVGIKMLRIDNKKVNAKLLREIMKSK